MKKSIISLLAVLLVLSSVQISNSTTYDITDDPADYLIGNPPDQYSHTFDLTQPPNQIPANEYIVSASLVVRVRDDQGLGENLDSEYAVIFGDGVKLLTTGRLVNGSAFGSGSTYTTVPIDVKTQLEDNNKLDLAVQQRADADGGSGDFHYRYSTLTVETGVIPIPASVLLLGSGLLGLGLLGFRRRKNI